MLPRIVTALVLIPAVLAFVTYARPLYFMLALGLLGTACLYEYFRLIRGMGLRGQPWFGYLAFWVLLIGLREERLPLTGVVAGVLLGGFLAAMWRRDALRERVLGMMANLLGVLYLAFFLYPAFPLRYDFGEELGLQWFLILLAVVWVGDTAALVIGSSFGRTLFSPNISPKKTNEGAVGGLLAGVLAAAALQMFFFADLPLHHVAAAAMLVGMFGQLGDLAESMLKRAAQVKDSSRLIPGHGGVLDRIDSMLFALPVLYVYLLRLYAA